jgi:hypothetical protein
MGLGRECPGPLARRRRGPRDDNVWERVQEGRSPGCGANASLGGWRCRRVRDPSTPRTDSLCESVCCAQDDRGRAAGLKPGSSNPSLYRGAEALRHPKSTLRGAEAPLFHGAARLRLGFRFFRAVENVVNRQKLHDWGYVLASKGKIVSAKVTVSPFAG